MKNNLIARSVKISLLGLCLAMLTAAQKPGDPDPTRVERPSGPPISSILNTDGSIKPGVSGSFDPKGFRMMTGRDGKPRFIADSAASTGLSAEADCNDGWDERFWTNGVSGDVIAIASDSSGNIYFGGRFSAAGNVAAANIVKWDGTSWTALGSGLNGGVWAIAVSGTDIYVGGEFTSAGGTSANHIARWDGSNWSAMDSGMNWTVRAIAVSGTNVYAGGNFTSAGGVPANYIAKWDGGGWSALGHGTGTFGYVYAIAISGADVYVGGQFEFTTANGSVARRIAKWNGTAGWSTLGSGMGFGSNWGEVRAIVVSGTDVYVGGDFSTAGGVPAKGIAKWNGSSWFSLGSGIGAEVPGVLSIAVFGTDVYVGGFFTSGGGGPASYIAKWNGSSWSALGSGTDYTVQAMAVSGQKLYVACFRCSTAGGVPVRTVAEWDGSNWSTLGTATGLGVNGSVYAVAVSGTDVYVGGLFNSAGPVAANGIAKWNGTSWSALGSGIVDGDYRQWVNVIAVSGSDVYVAGRFITAGGIPANHIAKWNGSGWSALGNGVNGEYPSVSALAISGSDLYVGGSFTAAGGNAANGIAKWNGTNWSALGTGVGGYYPGDYPGVYAVTVSGSDVYIGGYFAAAGGVAGTQSFAKWNGTAWSAAGLGISGEEYVFPFVSALAVSGNDVYVGGGFKSAGGVAGTEGIAKWNGSSWSALGLGLVVPISCPWECWYGGVYDLAVSGSDVYVGGDFATADGVAGYIAKWNGSGWSALGSGTNYPTYALAVSSSDLYVGGGFTTAGCHAAAGFSRYSLAVFEVSGRVIASAGISRPRVRVTLDNGMGDVRFALTNPFGYFRFRELPAGTYTITAESKRLGSTSTTVNVSSSIMNLELVL